MVGARFPYGSVYIFLVPTHEQHESSLLEAQRANQLKKNRAEYSAGNPLPSIFLPLRPFCLQRFKTEVH
jgi:hypothetical protein